jgi:hypothetical protein
VTFTLTTIAEVTKGFWVAYVVVVVLWALDLLYLAGLTLVIAFFGDSPEPVRITGRDGRFATSHDTGLPALPVVAAVILAVVLMVMAVRARARVMAWVFGICGILVPVWAYVA